MLCQIEYKFLVIVCWPGLGENKKSDTHLEVQDTLGFSLKAAGWASGLPAKDSETSQPSDPYDVGVLSRTPFNDKVFFARLRLCVLQEPA